MAKPTCPICGEATDPAYRPFCSARHRDRDLLQWLGEGYRIPGGPAAPEGLDNPEEHD
ncbi:DNA gyrase inhibitor YacG [Sphingomonas sp. Leaf339]|uniref:DNA gyrase inhibitor YacG n=1 Tax=Sphingomonas sp. Leaf339 TaxID=1736343 RepID=UPI0009E91DE9|nr:DNA gyrase inhibitor YacG [Sphingomonas sp. Leaf339]